jgi:hypothetical protein
MKRALLLLVSLVGCGIQSPDEVAPDLAATHADQRQFEYLTRLVQDNYLDIKSTRRTPWSERVDGEVAELQRSGRYKSVRAVEYGGEQGYVVVLGFYPTDHLQIPEPPDAPIPADIFVMGRDARRGAQRVAQNTVRYYRGERRFGTWRKWEPEPKAKP